MGSFCELLTYFSSIVLCPVTMQITSPITEILLIWTELKISTHTITSIYSSTSIKYGRVDEWYVQVFPTWCLFKTVSIVSIGFLVQNNSHWWDAGGALHFWFVFIAFKNLWSLNNVCYGAWNIKYWNIIKQILNYRLHKLNFLHTYWYTLHSS